MSEVYLAESEVLNLDLKDKDSRQKGTKMDKEERIFWAWAEACDKMAEEQAREEGRMVSMKMIKKYERFKSGAECIELSKQIDSAIEEDIFYNELAECRKK